MIDHKRLVLDGGIGDETMVRDLVARDLERREAFQTEAGHNLEVQRRVQNGWFSNKVTLKEKTA